MTDFATWAGVTHSYAVRSWRLIEPELTEVEYNGRPLFSLMKEIAYLENPPTPKGVRLLPPYEPFLQQRDRETLAPDPALHERIWKKTGNPGVILSDGELVALWRHRKKGRTLLISVEPLGAIDQEAVRAEAAPYAAFRGCQAVELVEA